MREGHTTTAVARPRSAPSRTGTRRSEGHTAARPPAGNGRDGTRGGGRPTDDPDRIVPRRPHRWLLGVLGLAVVGAIGASLFVLPVQAWLRQEDELGLKQQELAVLTEANRKLDAEVRHLETPAGAREAARDELGVVSPGEHRISVLAGDVGLLPLPAGWPYDAITQIVNLRQTEPAAPPAP
jgi:cell division protein FtsB